MQDDINLLWIADEALQAEDTEGWEQCESPNGDMYYLNTVTKQVLWQHPLDYTYQQKYLAAKAGAIPKTPDVTQQQSPLPQTRQTPSDSLSQAPIGFSSEAGMQPSAVSSSCQKAPVSGLELSALSAFTAVMCDQPSEN